MPATSRRWATDIPRYRATPGRHFLARTADADPAPRRGVLDALTGGQDTIGLRVPDHPLALALLREFGGRVAAPSANRFGHVSPTTAAHVREGWVTRWPSCPMADRVSVGIESTILDLSGPTARILRPGMLDAATIGAVIGAVPSTASAGGSVPRVSGT